MDPKSKFNIALLSISVMILLSILIPRLTYQDPFSSKISKEDKEIIENNSIGFNSKPLSKKTIKTSKTNKLPLKKITLEADNTIVFRGPVSASTVGKAKVELLEASRITPDDKPIYLILDTPGGSVSHGVSLMEFAGSLPEEVKTITIFAASMGFHFAQSMGERLILQSGVMMSHKARISGLRGEFDGQLESRYNMIKKRIDYMDFITAKRIDMKFGAYKDKIDSEYWIHGFEAIDENVADSLARIQCGDSMKGTETLKIRTFLGTIKLRFSKCPMIRVPLSADVSRITKEKRSEVRAVVMSMFLNPESFVKNYIVNNKIYNYIAW